MAACDRVPKADRPTERTGGLALDYETLNYEQDEHVVTLTYNRPDQHNAVNRTMNSELHHAWQRFRDDDDAFVLVITGAG
jgi:enoyl-CoA hydratase/carnithine racemase